MNARRLIVCLFILLNLVWCKTAEGKEPSQNMLQVLYNSLDPFSISQHLAFYELYGQTPLGKQAMADAWRLLSGEESTPHLILSNGIPLSSSALQILVSMVNNPVKQEITLSDPEIRKALIKLSTRLHHYSLKGHLVWSEEDVLKLPLEEIDLARGLFISQFGSDRPRIETYEALIDLMALQILARLPSPATPEQKIIAINRFIFEEMGFRFPPHSLYAKDIDLYTFLPSVIDSRRGVCLGVSILYMCLAQRLALPLEMITPPGHIYVRYRNGSKEINIETTARGIHMDSDEYLSMNNRSLQKRTVREVIGMAYFNQASVYWQNSEYQKALDAYEKAAPYMAGDPLLKEFMSYALILTGNKAKGESFLSELRDFVPPYAIVKDYMIGDYLSGNVDADGIAVIFTKVDEDRESILKKKNALEEAVKKYPRFRTGILTLATTWLQLHRMGEALALLEELQKQDDQHPEVLYYLSVLYTLRNDYPKAWRHLQQAERITSAHGHYPNALKEMRRELLNCCPE